jgi:Fe2+ or Zn2+ uptake regulation protein
VARPFQYRDAVLALLEENPIHPTVEWIHRRLRARSPRVSLATVYRTLRALVAEGVLCELPFGTSEARFGLISVESHYHFICDACHRVFDLPVTPRVQLERSVQADTGHQVSRHTMEFYGRCRECADKSHTRRPRRPRREEDRP